MFIIIFFLSLLFSQDTLSYYKINKVTLEGRFVWQNKIHHTLEVLVTPGDSIPKYYVTLNDSIFAVVQTYPRELIYETPLEFTQAILDSILIKINKTYWEELIEKGENKDE
jgi:hypothetical protein